jgi:hypothetical protein
VFALGYGTSTAELNGWLELLRAHLHGNRAMPV